MTTQVRVDFNSVTKDGQVKATARRADGPLAEGDPVIAYDPAERLAHPAVVASINLETGRVLLAVDWQQSAPDRTNNLSAAGQGVPMNGQGQFIVRQSRVEQRQPVSLKA